MKNISFDEGFREYKMNGDDSRVIRIRLTDPNLYDRIQKSMDKIEEVAEKYKGQNNPELIPELNADVRNIINEAFGSDICTPAFGTASPFTVLGGNKLLFEEFFESFLPVLEQDLKAVTASLSAQVRPEVQKYLEPELPDVSNLTDEQKRQLIAQLS